MDGADKKDFDSLPMTLVLQLDEVCGRFETAWQAGERQPVPRIEDYLGTAAGDEEQATAHEPLRMDENALAKTDAGRPLREALVRELVRIDIAYRRRAGEAPGPEEYLSRFPDLDRDWLAAALGAPPREALPSRAGMQLGTDTEVGVSLTPAPGGSAMPDPGGAFAAAADRPAPPVGAAPSPTTLHRHDGPPASSAAPVAVPPSPPPDFEILGELGRGGMGVVYKARQKSLNRTVALKMILDGIPLTAPAVQRFHREARAAAALDHPNIVAVHTTGEHNGRPYFAMAYVEGENLREVVRSGGLPTPQRTADLLGAVAEAVGFAHEKGIVHRDLKPENVLLDRHGRPRITDFGLAYHTEAEDVERLTRSGMVLGTPAYMAPEQAMGDHEATGPAADVYSLGGILYFLLTGQPPFQGRTVTEVLVQVMTQPPRPPRQLRSQAPRELEAICLRCLEKKPAHRYPSAAALAEALRTAGVDTQVEPAASDSATLRPSPPPAAAPACDAATPAPAQRGGARGTRLVLAACLLGALAAGVWLTATLLSGKGAGPEPPRRNVVEEPPLLLPAAQLAPPDKLRTDFGLEVAMIGRQPDAAGFVDLRPGPDGILKLRVDQEVKFRIKVAQQAYVGIWSIETDGTVLQLFPNADEKDFLFTPDKERVVPQTKAEAVTTIEKGKCDWVWVQAATRHWNPELGEVKKQFRLFQTDRQRGLWWQERGIRLRRPELKLAETVLKYRVGP